VILCHGLASGRGAVRASAINLAKQGVTTLIFDFRGHGKSEGIFDGNEVEDIIAAWKQLSEYDGIDKDRIALVGHSIGARAVILAAGRVDKPRAIVALSCPSDLAKKLEEYPPSQIKHWKKHAEAPRYYPRDGLLPWLSKSQAILAWLWMFLCGYRMKVDWLKCYSAISTMRMMPTLQGLDCQKLFVHCKGDTLISSPAAFETASEPKELFLEQGGQHSAPLMRGDLRTKWITWLVNALTNR
jgi:pimeloyl-ACP methyl ester carboxylesterase